ncbi:MAG TPA: hypothetical protein IAA59_08545 [Candidatus Faecaligallichristensenella faecipullorum]|nr:hypothetical protein [Candidatus Faecaligallichristensenella faecipullorum]
MDDHTLAMLSRLAPDLMHQLGERAAVLERISALQPVGRRALAQRLQIPEREVRAISESLRRDGFIEVGAAGMVLTGSASEVLSGAKEMVRSLMGLNALELQLAHLLNADRVVVVAGNADEDEHVLDEVGRSAASRLRHYLSDGSILAVTGGGTIAKVARYLPQGSPMDVTVLPARGGVGRKVETQANTLAAELAHKLGGTHRLLHLPDSIGSEALRELCKLPEIREPMDMLKKANVLLSGIGRSDDMAAHRRMSQGELELLRQRGAVAEALGVYFDAQGHPLVQASSLGLDITHIGSIPSVIAVAAGRRKAEAILAVARHHHHALLVMDEGAARAILALLRHG